MVDKNMLIADVIKKYPETINVLEKYNMSCASCKGIRFETIEKGGIMHGIDVNELINEINTTIK